MFSIAEEHYDVIVIGSGGSGLVSALNLAKSNLKTAVLSKVFPTRSHTVSAKGGINAPLGNVTEDNPEWLMYDTIKGGDWLSDHDSVEMLCHRAKSAIINLEHIGVPFTRDKNGKIYQRVYGGQTTNFGKGGLAHRACSAADRTGHAILQNLYQSALQEGVSFYNEIFVLDLIITNQKIKGVIAWNFHQARLVFFKSNFVVMATGGFGQLYHTNTSSSICTGDGNAMALRAGIMLQDMEFIQFHPRGIYNLGILITEAARSEGGYLINSLGKRFMTDYAPKYKELASRDIISRAIINEVSHGRGVGKNKDHIYLDISHLGKTKLLQFLPTIYETCKTFLGIDITKDPIPVSPSVHYTMGGIPTNKYGEVSYQKVKISGLYAIGEAASASIHGANRLGCNSLLELVVYGEIVSERIANQYEKENSTIDNSSEIELLIKQKIESFYSNFSEHNDNTQDISRYRKRLGLIMEKNIGVIRSEESLVKAKLELETISQEINKLTIKNKTLHENPILIELLELKNLTLQAKVVTEMSLWRTESRGAHFRNDFKERNDIQFLKHSLCGIDSSGKLYSSHNPIRQLDSNLSKKFHPQKRTY